MEMETYRKHNSKKKMMWQPSPVFTFHRKSSEWSSVVYMVCMPNNVGAAFPSVKSAGHHLWTCQFNSVANAIGIHGAAHLRPPS